MKRKRNMKLITLILAIVMVVSFIPLGTAFAASDDEKEITKVELELKAPKGGSEVIVDYSKSEVKNGPQVTVKTKGVSFVTENSYWVEDPGTNIEREPAVYIGYVEPGKMYGADIRLQTQEGYSFSQNLEIVLKGGGTVAAYEAYPYYEGGSGCMILAKIKATETTSPKAGPSIRAKVTGAKDSLKVSWSKVNGAKRYVVIAYKCGEKKIAKKAVVKASATSYTLSNLDKKKAYKIVVAAQKKVNGKFKTVAKSRPSHAVVKNNLLKTNPTGINVSKKAVTVKKGSTVKVKGKVVKGNTIKTMLNKKHGSKVRFQSTNKKIATVTDKGVIKGKAAGTCTIYALTFNGISAPIKVTVTEDPVEVCMINYYMFYSEEYPDENYKMTVQGVVKGKQATLLSFDFISGADEMSWIDVKTDKKYQFKEKITVTKDLDLVLSDIRPFVD